MNMLTGLALTGSVGCAPEPFERKECSDQQQAVIEEGLRFVNDIADQIETVTASLDGYGKETGVSTNDLLDVLDSSTIYCGTLNKDYDGEASGSFNWGPDGPEIVINVGMEDFLSLSENPDGDNFYAAVANAENFADAIDVINGAVEVASTLMHEAAHAKIDVDSEKHENGDPDGVWRVSNATGLATFSELDGYR